jgi:hypothetical protein
MWSPTGCATCEVEGALDSDAPRLAVDHLLDLGQRIGWCVDDAATDKVVGVGMADVHAVDRLAEPPGVVEHLAGVGMRRRASKRANWAGNTKR